MLRVFIKYLEYNSNYLQKQCNKIFALRDKLSEEGIPEGEINAMILSENDLAK